MRIHACILTMLLVGPITAQTARFDIGMEGGPTRSFLRGNRVHDGHGILQGYYLGPTFQYNFPRIISIRTAVAYVRKGSSFSLLAADQNGNIVGEIPLQNRFNYVVLPVLVRASFGRKVAGFINVGPYGGYLLRQVVVSGGELINSIRNESTNDFKRFDLGLSAGIGIAVPMKGKFGVTLELRHDVGLTDTSKLPVIDNGSINTNATTLLFGFAYKLGKRI